MKQSVKLILLVVLIVGVMVGAFFGYRALTQKAPEESQATASQPAEAEASAEEPAEPSAPSEGASAGMAPDFSVTDKDGNTVKLSEKIGTPVVLNFWASWCGPCKSELPAFDATAKAHTGEVEFMMVNLTDGYQETQDSAKAFLEESGYTFPVYFDLDGSAAGEYGVYSIPMTVFIRADGTVAKSHTGVMTEAQLETYLAAITDSESNA